MPIDKNGHYWSSACDQGHPWLTKWKCSWCATSVLIQDEQAPFHSSVCTGPTTRDGLMSQVSLAVVEAEEALKVAIERYHTLAKAEQAIVDSPETDDDDKQIAARGTENAKQILEQIRKVFPWEPGK
jgi:hypothetical protein